MQIDPVIKDYIWGREIWYSMPMFPGCPLLFKVIEANDKLSVQVHPDDAFANENENGKLGKTEAWYVMDAKPGAQLVFGLKPGVTKASFIEALNKGEVESTLNFVDAKTGDFFYIPAGTVHAIGAGLTIAEIQQCSDITYRLYDYKRVDANGNERELHVEKALETINFGGTDYV